ncbi:hypothetical protein POTOM_039231 [Populus tomentosa]|uniref:Mitochondrial pyruvate carrier n=1 Tax=Populus tomentosa TaxID=118781 RepID=A0A8X8CIV9_POPTO|nr:hypothetical protein POTOM_039231 [Populus tomentosa]
MFHFWAPTFKWGISIANIADFAKPPEKLSYPQQIAVTCTGVIWSRYSTVITPVSFENHSVLFFFFLLCLSLRIFNHFYISRHDYFSEEEAAVAKE